MRALLQRLTNWYRTKEHRMSNLNELKARYLADGVIDDAEVKELRTQLFADGKIDRDEVELLIGLRNEAKKTCPAFEQLFIEALKANMLADGSIDDAEAAWLRKAVFADGKVDETEKKLLQELHIGARQVSPAFQQLFDERLPRSLVPRSS